MEEIKVGEYVRTKQGDIGKYVIRQSINFVETNNGFIGFDIENDIVKHSPNIIDLIEVGDYVNGYRVKEIGIYTENEIAEIYGICSNLKEIENKLNNKKWYLLDNCDLMPLRNCKNDSIKSIVTKEQFNQVKYEV